MDKNAASTPAETSGHFAEDCNCAGVQEETKRCCGVAQWRKKVGREETRPACPNLTRQAH